MTRLACMITTLNLLLSSAPTHAGSQPAQVSLDVALANPTLLMASRQTTYLKVGLHGVRPASDGPRPPVNIALVLDKSGSMNGSKLAQAKNAAIRSLDMLNDNDIISVIVYDTSVRVIVPATKLTDKQMVVQAIQSINADGNTALFAGVSKGAAEIRKFIDRKRVNRVILLSDGLANEGPSSPGMLGDLGASLMKEGIAVSTLGLGLDYNEDLMYQLAYRSDGNHVFVEEATELASVFTREFQDVLSVVAQEIAMTIRCAPGIRPVRLLGIDGEISGQEVVVRLNQLYGGQEKYALLEIEVPESQSPDPRHVAGVEVAFAEMKTGAPQRLTANADVNFDASASVVQDRVNDKVMTECVLQIANERNALATVLRDEGKLEQAKDVLMGNCKYLADNAQQLKSELLQKRAEVNREQSQNLDGKDWDRTRKDMRSGQYNDGRGGSYKNDPPAQEPAK